MKKILKKIMLLALLLSLFLISTFIGCARKEVVLDNDNVTYMYYKRFEKVDIKNNYDIPIYVNFDVNLLDENEEVLHKETFEKVIIPSKEIETVNLEDIGLSVSYDYIDSMEVEITKVSQYSNGLTAKQYITAFVIVCGITFIIAIVTAPLAWKGEKVSKDEEK